MGQGRRYKSGVFHFLEWLIFPLPIEFSILKRALLKVFGAQIGKGVLISNGAWVESPWDLTIGDNSWIDRNVTLISGVSSKEGRLEIVRKATPEIGRGKLWIGKNCHIAVDTVIQAHGGVKIGDQATITSGCRVYSMSHHYRDPDGKVKKTFVYSSRAKPEDQCVIIAPVIIEEGATVGLNSVILPGVIVGRGAVVAVLSYVKDDVPAGTLVAGNPAETVKTIRPWSASSDPS